MNNFNYILSPIFLFIFISLSLSSCKDVPDMNIIKENFEKNKPFLEMKNFKKVDGVEMEINGIKAYQVKYDAVIIAKKDLHAYYEFGDSTLHPDDDAQWQSYYKMAKGFRVMRQGDRKYVPGDTVAIIKGKKYTFGKTENGWQ